MPPSGSPVARRRLLAAELRRLRTGTGKTAAAVGVALGWSKAKVSRYELAQTGLKPDDVARLLDLYDLAAAACVSVTLSWSDTTSRNRRSSKAAPRPPTTSSGSFGMTPACKNGSLMGARLPG
jgi:transcriptional regulator with XRE-family HTH domain